jgi:hypothetical protein
MQDVMNPPLQIQMQYGTAVSCLSVPCQIRIRGSPGLGLLETRSPFQPNEKPAGSEDGTKYKYK